MLKWRSRRWRTPPSWFTMGGAAVGIKRWGVLRILVEVEHLDGHCDPCRKLPRGLRARLQAYGRWELLWRCKCTGMTRSYKSRVQTHRRMQPNDLRLLVLMLRQGMVSGRPYPLILYTARSRPNLSLPFLGATSSLVIEFFVYTQNSWQETVADPGLGAEPSSRTVSTFLSARDHPATRPATRG